MALVDLSAALGTAGGFWLGVVGHEFATAFATDRAGDRSARLQRRVSVDVRRHADTLGTYLFPAVFVFSALFKALLGIGIMPFAFARPHAIGSGFIKTRGRRIWVSAVGPLVMFGLAAGFASLSGAGELCSSIGRASSYAAYVLTSMAVIELLPIPGRDGGRILAEFLSPTGRAKMLELERYAVAFVLGLLVILGFLAARVVAAGLELLPGRLCL